MQDTIAKILNGDREAFRLIIHEYGPGIRAFLASHLMDASTVDDLAQETFIAAYEDLEKYDASRAEPGPWIRGIARNKLLMHLRRTYRRDEVHNKLKARITEEISPLIDHTVLDDRETALATVGECLEKLPDRIRTVVQARYFSRQKVQAIAGEMTTTVSAISSLLYRGRKLLESCIGMGGPA